jgi:hypothetical protein
MTRVSLIQRTPKRSRNYARGANFERTVRADLERTQPGSVVVRAAGSRGPVDVLWCWRGFDRPRGVQCKSASGMSKQARIELAEHCIRAGWLPILATKEPRGWRYQRVLDDGSLIEWLSTEER